jgi:dTMP kinase
MGRYFIIEGDEGAGKTTQVGLLRDRLRWRGRNAEVVREPGGDPFGELLRLALKADAGDIRYINLRRQFLNGQDAPIGSLAETFAFLAARVNSRSQVVYPKLVEGIDVLSDRGELSTLVYQGEAGNVNRTFLGYNCDYVAKLFPPTLTIVLDVSLTVSQERQAARGGVADRFESKGDLYRRRVNDGYRRLALEKGLPLIDGEQRPEEVHELIWQHIEPLL